MTGRTPHSKVAYINVLLDSVYAAVWEHMRVCALALVCVCLFVFDCVRVCCYIHTYIYIHSYAYINT